MKGSSQIKGRRGTHRVLSVSTAQVRSSSPFELASSYLLLATCPFTYTYYSSRIPKYHGLDQQH